ncbi:hypothetical protein [Methanolobus sp. ZRKC5]|uniref:hypothetical protein n=1 Tax=unclassified Methanolobus TaxID=2629569 RepID=UPI00313ABB73
MGTYKLSSQRRTEGSGSKKLREHRESTSSSSSKTETPAEYRAKVEAQKSAKTQQAAQAKKAREQQIINQYQSQMDPYQSRVLQPASSTTSQVSIVSETRQSVPSPVRPEYQAAYAEAQSTSPHQLHGSDPASRMSITSTPNVDNGLNLPTETTPLGVEYSRLQDKVSEKIPTYDALISKRNEYELSHPTMLKAHTAVYDTAHQNENVGAAVDTFSSFGKGVYSGVQEHPVDIALMVGMGALTGPAMGVLSKAPGVARAGAAVTKIPVVGNTIARYGAGVGLTGLYGLDLNSRITAPVLTGEGFERDPTTQEKAERFGTAVSTEIIPFTIGAGAGAMKSKLPAITSSSTEQGFLLKMKVPEAVKIQEPVVKPTTEATYKGSAFGVDSFEIKAVNREITTIKPQQPATDVLIGKKSGGYTDIYVELSDKQAAAISKQYTGKLRNIKTSEGSFVEFEPTGKIESAIYEKSGATKINAPDTSGLIGDMPEISTTKFTNPFRVEKRVDLQKGELTIGDSNVLQLPEFTREINVDGKVVNDFNIYDYYKKPDFQEPKMLESGLVKDRSLKNFISDEQGALAVKPRYNVKDPFIGEMPPMTLKSVKVEQPLATYKDSDVSMIDRTQKFSDINEAAKRNIDPSSIQDSIISTQIKQFSNSKRSANPLGLVFSVGSTVPQIKPIPDSFPRPNTNNEKSTKPYRDSIPEPSLMPDVNPSPRPRGKQKETIPDPVSQISRSLASMEVPPVILPEIPNYTPRRKAAEKRTTKRGSGKEKNLFNRYGNPLEVPKGLDKAFRRL